MFCEKCGKEIPDGSTFCPECGEKIRENLVKPNKEKNMIVALVISFLLSGLGIAYAGNVKKGILLFVGTIVFNVLGFAIPICLVIGILIWAYGLYDTYNQVRIANGIENPDLIEDFKSWPNSKKACALIIVGIVLLAVVGGVILAFAPPSDSDDDVYYSDDLDSSSSSGSPSSSSSPSSSGSSSSSSSDGYDTHSHYEGEYGSSDTYGTVNDDGSVDAHQTGHTDYGDYEIDSHMDSDGNLEGTVEVDGQTYHVSSG